MNIHDARRAGRRSRKACMGWSWAAACGVQGRGHFARLPAQLVAYRPTLNASAYSTCYELRFIQLVTLRAKLSGAV